MAGGAIKERCLAREHSVKPQRYQPLARLEAEGATPINIWNSVIASN
jgi:hypothetical protein